nr:NB-ARC domain-containing protein [Nostoc sp. DedQUE03]MDZ7976444.1 NB-ARC domain-containing protein [Nostoc sp. DedQUE03]
MLRKIRWDESVKENTLYLVEALLCHADDEFEDEELKTTVYVEWKTENKLRVTGFEDKQTTRKRKQTVEVGTKKEHLLKLLKKAGKSLKLPKPKNEVSKSLQNRELDEIQTALDCLKELEVREDEKSIKNQGYWKFTLTLVHQTKREENLKLVKQKWKEHPKTNLLKTREPEQFEILIPPENLPRSGVVEFVGRQDELKLLHQQLQQTKPVAISAIAGMGGIGKTELALQYALYHLHKGTYPGGVCWLIARQEKETQTVNIGTQIVAYAVVYLGLRIPNGLELTDQVAFCWRNWREGEVLVVLDDVTDYKDIKPYLPPQIQRFKVLMTTRLEFGSPIQTILLGVLAPEKSLELLEVQIGKKRVGIELEIAKSLSEWLGHLPLGLELVGRYVAKKPNLSLAEMLFRLQRKAEERRSLKDPSLGGNPNDPTWILTAKRGVEAAFELSWEELDVNSQHLGKLLSLFALAPIPWNLVEDTERRYSEMSPNNGEFEPEELEASLDRLLQLHLVQHISQYTYLLHSLIREFFKSKLEGETHATY